MSRPDDLIATMDSEPSGRHVLAAAITAEARLVATANVTDFRSPRSTTPGRVAIETPNDFLITSLRTIRTCAC